MKIQSASTEMQEEKIRNLINYFYVRIFPMYFSEQEIQLYKKMNVLYISPQNREFLGTLRESFTVISCLDTLISIIESSDVNQNQHHYEQMFVRNVEILSQKDVFFPFSYALFVQKLNQFDPLTVFDKPANEYLA
ncbi:DUF5365 family protein [Bacillus spongiae]|uniref:DUF5365 family protein n=1 Tax=Bacillus spongiae TaxID=2683610 RepID=A0ABU8HB53_9BACI